MGMIVQLSVSCTERMIPVQTKLHNDSVDLWFSHFDDRPAKLFDGLQHIRVTIILSHKGKTDNTRTWSTSYSRWRSIARVQLFHTLALTSIEGCLRIVEGSIPKIGQVLGSNIIQRISDHEKLGNRLLKHGSGLVYYHNAPQYWIRAMDFAPYFWNERDGEQVSTQVKKLVLDNNTDAAATVGALNSSLFYWWFLILSDCRHLNLREVETFPLGLDRMTMDMKARLAKLTDRLMANFNQHKTRKETLYQTTGKVIYNEFNQKPSKPIIDEIDHVLAAHYGFTDEELDFIVNYDIKYRMGR